MKNRLSALALTSLCLFLSGTLGATEKYQAMFLTRGGPAAESTVKIQIIIDGYTTGEEAWQLLQILDQGDFDPFLSAFRRGNKGIIIFPGSRGLKVIINVAHALPTEKGKRIVLFTERQSWDLSVSRRIDLRYPFMIVELDLDSKGRGDGKIYENAQIKISGDEAAGTAMMEMDSFNSAPKSIFRVTAVK